MQKEKRIITEEEKVVIQELNDSLYTVDYLGEWVNRVDNVIVNAPAALSAMGAKGYYRAVQLIVKNKNKE